MDFRGFWIYVKSGDLQQRMPDFGANADSPAYQLFQLIASHRRPIPDFVTASREKEP